LGLASEYIKKKKSVEVIKLVERYFLEIKWSGLFKVERYFYKVKAAF